VLLENVARKLIANYEGKPFTISAEKAGRQ